MESQVQPWKHKVVCSKAQQSETEQVVLEGRMGLPREVTKEMLCSIESGKHVHTSLEVLRGR